MLGCCALFLCPFWAEMSCAGSLATLPRPHWVEMSCIAALALCATRYAIKCFGFAVFGGVSGGAEHVLICVSKGFGVTIVEYEFRGLSGHFGSRGFGFEHSILLPMLNSSFAPYWAEVSLASSR